MGNLDRVQLLRKFIDVEQENPFNYYALALELRESEPLETVELFDFLPMIIALAHLWSNSDRKKIEK
jgi:hypothetical protein